MTAQRPHTHMHTQAKLLPALSVVNHATGQHIVISGFDKVRLTVCMPFCSVIFVIFAYTLQVFAHASGSHPSSLEPGRPSV